MSILDSLREVHFVIQVQGNEALDAKKLINVTHVMLESGVVYPVLNYFFTSSNYERVIAELGLSRLYNEKHYLTLIGLLYYMSGVKNQTKSKFFSNISQVIDNKLSTGFKNQHELLLKILREYGYNKQEEVGDFLVQSKISNLQGITDVFLFLFNVISMFDFGYQGRLNNFCYIADITFNDYYRTLYSSLGGGEPPIGMMQLIQTYSLPNYAEYIKYSNVYEDIYLKQSIDITYLRSLKTLTDKFSYLYQFKENSIKSLINRGDIQFANKLDMINYVIEKMP